MVRILGIDPGSLFTGYGIVDYDGQRLCHVASGCLRLAGEPFNARLRGIFEGVRAVLKEFSPQELAVEQAFVHKNAGSALKLGQARAAAICASFVNPAQLFEYTPRAVKLALTGKGSADKEQVQHMVKVLLGLHQALQADSADALAVAICHAHSRGLAAKLGSAG
ncbi:MAG: crossover junction endodeoxyribonuclease RuvC [Gammaproteobacteria bacterium]